MTGTPFEHHHHWVLVDGYTSVYDCACGATRGDRTLRPGAPVRRHPLTPWLHRAS